MSKQSKALTATQEEPAALAEEQLAEVRGGDFSYLPAVQGISGTANVATLGLQAKALNFT